jgi:hypothetical protein
MKSLETQISERVDLAKKNGKGSEAAAIIQENLGKQLERKLAALETLTKPFMEAFQESAGKNELVESFRVNFNMTESEARIAAGVERSNKNGSVPRWEY